MTNSMHMPIAAAACVRTVPPIGHALGDSSVFATFAQRAAVVGAYLGTDDVEGVPPRGVPV